MIALALFALQATAAPAQPAIALPAPAGPAMGTDVVVVGRSLRDTEDALRRCLARHCPPKEDIDASLAHAENQFLVGDFKGARGTLTSSRGRNKRFARELPVPVSELLRVDALVGSLLGERDYARIGTIDSVSALKAGLPRDDQRIAAQRLLVAAVFAREGRFQTAINMCDAVAERAAEMGWGALQGEAMFRAAALYGMASTIDPAYASEARARLRKLEELRAPGTKSYADAAGLIQVKIAQMRHDEKALAAAQARMRTMRVDQAMLLYAPDVDLANPTVAQANLHPTFDLRGQWIDLSFTVAPDGRVRDLQEIGRGPRVEGRWVALAREAVAKREYVPLDQPADGPGIAQAERVVLVSDVGFDTGTHMRRPVGPPRLQFVALGASGRPAVTP